jgi:cell division protein FtsB
MDNLVLIVVFGVLALYFYSSMSVYKSMYKKIKEEKDITFNAKNNQGKHLEKYASQLKASIETIKGKDENLIKVREEMQGLKLRNNELAHRNQLLQERVDELYSSVGII